MSNPSIEKFPPVVDILTRSMQTGIKKRQQDWKKSMFKDIPIFPTHHWGDIYSSSPSVSFPYPQENQKVMPCN